MSFEKSTDRESFRFQALVADGTSSNTIALCLQVDNTAAVPFGPKPADWERRTPAKNANESGLNQPVHPGVFMAGFADGSIQIFFP